MLVSYTSFALRSPRSKFERRAFLFYSITKSPIGIISLIFEDFAIKR